MSYREDFQNSSGWSVADVSVRLNNDNGKRFLRYLESVGVHTVVRYYASSQRPKTLTPAEAKYISEQGFAILPVFQDSSRSIANFSKAIGKRNAQSAKAFAARVGQPKGAGSTIMFAVDADYTAAQIDGPILDHFQALKSEIGSDFRIGAYGSGAVLAKLLAERLIEVPWISMSRLFLGTESFFYSNRWGLRQVPPEAVHPETSTGYDRNIVRIQAEQLGAFQVDAAGRGSVVGAEDIDATLGGGMAAPVAESISGATLIVTTEGLRLRDAPNGVIKRELTIADRVEDLGHAVDGWHKVRAGSDEGYCFGAYLRAPGRPEVEALLRTTVDEWVRFEKGKALEEADPYYKYVRDMWAAIGEPWDGRSKYDNGTDVPWSAAFISWVVRRAGPAYGAFQFAASHSVFVNNAIKARMTNRLDKPFWGYRVDEVKPEIGDIVQRSRGGTSISYSYAENHLQYNSHSDVVVEVRPDVVRVIGGNVGETVSMAGGVQEYELNDAGYIKPDQKVISILKNRAGT